MRWKRVRPCGWICEDGRYIAKFNYGVCYVYLLYESKAEYEKEGSDYITFYKLKDAKNNRAASLA